MESKVDSIKFDSLSEKLLERILEEINTYSEEIKNSLNISNEKFKEDLYKIVKNEDIIDKYILD